MAQRPKRGIKADIKGPLINEPEGASRPQRRRKRDSDYTDIPPFLLPLSVRVRLDKDSRKARPRSAPYRKDRDITHVRLPSHPLPSPLFVSLGARQTQQKREAAASVPRWRISCVSEPFWALVRSRWGVSFCRNGAQSRLLLPDTVMLLLLVGGGGGGDGAAAALRCG